MSILSIIIIQASTSSVYRKPLSAGLNSVLLSLKYSQSKGLFTQEEYYMCPYVINKMTPISKFSTILSIHGIKIIFIQ